jgi:hypothetical protein
LHHSSRLVGYLQKAQQDTRHASQNAPERAQDAPVKNFAVDDAIEARQAVHDKAVDEYNAGTEAAPDTAAPANAPAPDGPPHLIDSCLSAQAMLFCHRLELNCTSSKIRLVIVGPSTHCDELGCQTEAGAPPVAGNGAVGHPLGGITGKGMTQRKSNA